MFTDSSFHSRGASSWCPRALTPSIKSAKLRTSTKTLWFARGSKRKLLDIGVKWPCSLVRVTCEVAMLTGACHVWSGHAHWCVSCVKCPCSLVRVMCEVPMPMGRVISLAALFCLRRQLCGIAGVWTMMNPDPESRHVSTWGIRGWIAITHITTYGQTTIDLANYLLNFTTRCWVELIKLTIWPFLLCFYGCETTLLNRIYDERYSDIESTKWSYQIINVRYKTKSLSPGLSPPTIWRYEYINSSSTIGQKGNQTKMSFSFWYETSTLWDNLSGALVCSVVILIIIIIMMLLLMMKMMAVVVTC